jgi:hypothetical protein
MKTSSSLGEGEAPSGLKSASYCPTSWELGPQSYEEENVIISLYTIKPTSPSTHGTSAVPHYQGLVEHQDPICRTSLKKRQEIQELASPAEIIAKTYMPYALKSHDPAGGLFASPTLPIFGARYSVLGITCDVIRARPLGRHRPGLRYSNRAPSPWRDTHFSETRYGVRILPTYLPDQVEIKVQIGQQLCFAGSAVPLE